MPYKINPFTGKFDYYKDASETISHSELTDMPDVAGSNTDHDVRYQLKLNYDTDYKVYIIP